MKKAIIIPSVIIIVSVAALIVQDLTFKHTPESILKAHFKINLKGFDYTVETFREQWCQNGDGEAFAIYKFNELTQDNIDYLKGFGLKPLPIPEEEIDIMLPTGMPKEHFRIDTGYYIYVPLSSNLRDYRVLILDIEKNILIFYCQYI